MRRILILAAAIATATAMSPAAAEENEPEPICADVGITGIVNLNPPPVCAPYIGDTSCAGAAPGPPSLLQVTVQVCFPAVIGSGGG